MKFLLLFFLNFAHAEDFYNQNIQKIFNQRCIACHSCYDSPCQLNLQSYNGFERGLHPYNVYNGTRLNSVKPTRIEIDGKNVNDWRNLNFTAVHDNVAEKSIMLNILRKKNLELKDLPAKKVEESNYCPSTTEKLNEFLKLTPDLKMPYGFQPIEDNYQVVLEKWLREGAKGENRKIVIKDEIKEQVESWEKYLNRKSKEQKLVSRYIFEHLFLAHIYFEEDKNTFFRLVRSKTECKNEIDEINTRRPNEYPGSNNFFYCLKPITSTIVAKTHMPFLFSQKIMEKTEEIFFSKKWEAKSFERFEDSYSNAVAENPFMAFKDIPDRARYEFLLEHAHFMVSTFIKGPVCNGSNALNSIQEQFYVLFLKPEASFLVNTDGIDKRLDELLILPGIFGSDVKVTESVKLIEQLVDKRETYRKLKSEWFKKNFPKGIGYDALWNGDRKNDNALLTVFRHDDNALVVKGLKGDLSKTVFVLDYSLFERLVYNLVVNFDVFGNVGHQLLTRVYMDYIRMEAEENFLLFMPKEQRVSMRKKWYKGLFTNLKMNYFFPLIIKDQELNIQYKTKDYKKEFINTLLGQYFANEVKGEEDLINWKQVEIKNKKDVSNVERILSQLASERPYRSRRYPNFFPETSLLILNKKDGTKDIYTIIKNSEHENISWIIAESLRMAPEEDTLTILKGIYAFYPNFFFKVSEDKLEEFVSDAKKMKSKVYRDDFFIKYGISRVANDFWSNYDDINEYYSKTDQLNSGYLDLSRYLNQ